VLPFSGRPHEGAATSPQAFIDKGLCAHPPGSSRIRCPHLAANVVRRGPRAPRRARGEKSRPVELLSNLPVSNIDGFPSLLIGGEPVGRLVYQATPGMSNSSPVSPADFRLSANKGGLGLAIVLTPGSRAYLGPLGPWKPPHRPWCTPGALDRKDGIVRGRTSK